MGRPEKGGRCKRHPNHKQSNGVCPYCLHAKLKNLSSSSSSLTTNAASSTASSTDYSSYDSDISSYAESPPLPKLFRSRSFAFRGRKGKEKEKEKEDGEKKRRKSRRFWAKLMKVGGRRRGESAGLSHSKTVKEKPSSRWQAFFK